MGAYVTINPTPSGDITGSGTAGYLAMFTSANAIGDSTINQASGNTGVGMAASANTGFGITTTAATSGTKNAFYFLQTGNTNQTASTEASGALWNMGTRQWATGAITSQREFYIQSCAYSFVGASVITYAYGLYVEAPTASTNATITNAYAAGFSGYVNVIADTATIKLRSLVGTTSSAAIYLNASTPSANNPALYSTSGDTYLNSASSANNVWIQAGGNSLMRVATDRFVVNGIAQSSGTQTNFTFTVPANTGQTASTEITNFKVTGNTKTWAAGAITTQRWNYFTANTAAFASASTISDSYALYIERAVAGTNATITRNWALGLNGGIQLANNTIIGGIDSAGTSRDLITWSSSDNITITGRQGSTDINLNPTSGGIGLYVKSNGDGGIGVASPVARWHIVKTTEQLRVGYDASNYLSNTVSSTGVLTMAMTGTDPSIKILNNTAHKLSFWNKTPIAQPTTGITGAARVGGGGAAVTDTDTFGGYTIAQLAAVIINTGLAA